MPPIDGEEQRREIVRRIQQEYLQTEREHAETQAKAAQLEEKLYTLSDANVRAQRPLPLGDICPHCWFVHGRQGFMLNRPENPVQKMQDRFVCSICGYEEIRTA